jgi:hypothetical protein
MINAFLAVLELPSTEDILMSGMDLPMIVVPIVRRVTLGQVLMDYSMRLRSLRS